MKRHILLCGPIGCGKTTLIRMALGDRILLAGGFATVRVREGERLTGFDLVPAPSLAENEPRGERFLDFTSGSQFIREPFESTGIALLEQAAERDFAVFDEVGGMELLIPDFWKALVDTLSSPLPWICVLKVPEAVHSMERTLKTGRDIASRAGQLYRELTSDENTLTLTPKERGDAQVLSALRVWAEKYTQDRE